MNARTTVGHIHYFTKETALAALQDVGYETVDYFYTNISLDRSNRDWKTNLMNLFRRVFFLLNRDWTVRIFGGFSLLILTK